MTRLLLLLGALAIVLAPGAGARDSGLAVTLSPTSVTVPVGETFTVRALIRSDTSTGAPLLAHLDVVSLRTDVYVDPEDWSANRTQSVPALAAGASTTVTWSVKGVNAGRFDVHVVVLPVLAQGAGPVTVSTPVHATVTARRSLTAGGALGVVLGVPLLVGLAAMWGKRSTR